MIDGFTLWDDDGSRIDPNLVPKPALCSTCANDGDPEQEMLCTLTRLDQMDEEGFECGAFQPLRIEGAPAA